MKKTVLYDEHILNNARMVEYAGYLMPVEYSGLVNEHLAVRNSCGLFDVSHMGEIFITGVDALKFVDYMLTSKITSIDMRMSYGLLLNEEATIIDDVMCYRFKEDEIMLVVNAANKDKDYSWLVSKIDGYNINIVDKSEEMGLLALQGPKAYQILESLTNIDDMKMFDIRKLRILNEEFIVSRSGYTGEDGFEIYGDNQSILKLFKEFISMGVTLCGLGCRDTLRFEANMPLYGHEISDKINPLEATLSFAIDFEKEFYGKSALVKIKNDGIKRKIVGLEITGRGIARSDYEVYDNDKLIGFITTGYMVPGINKTYALAMLDEGYWDIGKEVSIKIRNNFVTAIVRNKKFLNKKYIK